MEGKETGESGKRSSVRELRADGATEAAVAPGGRALRGLVPRPLRGNKQVEGMPRSPAKPGRPCSADRRGCRESGGSPASSALPPRAP